MSFFKNSLFLGIGKALTALSALLISVFLSRNLDYENYASYKQIFVAIKIVSPFIILGLHQSLFFYIPREIDNAKKYLNINIAAFFILSAVFSLLFFIFQDDIVLYFDNALLSLVLPFVGIYFFFGLAMPTFDTVFVCVKQSRQLMFFNSATKFVLLLGVLFLLAVGVKNFEVFVQLQFALSVIFFLVGYYWLSRILPNFSGAFNFSDVISHLKFSVPLGLSSVMGVLAYNLDKLIVGGTASQKDFAIYANGAMELPMLSIVTGSVVSVLLPEFSKNALGKNFNKIKELWNYKLSKTAVIIFPIFAFLMIYAEEFMVALYGQKYLESAHVFRIFLLLLPLRIANYGSVFIAFGKNKLILFRTALEIVFLITLAYILNRYIGFYGVAWAFVLVTLIWSFGYSYFTIAKLLECSIIELLPLRHFRQILYSLAVPSAVIIFMKSLEISSTVKLLLALVVFLTLLLFLYHILGVLKLNVLLKKIYGK